MSESNNAREGIGQVRYAPMLSSFGSVKTALSDGVAGATESNKAREGIETGMAVWVHC
jgi:hypothetical protein